MIALSPNRLRLVTAGLVLGVVPAAAVALAWRSPALTHQTTTLAAASDAGRKLALDLALLALLQVPVAAGYIAVSARIRVSRGWSRAAGAALTLVLLGALAAVFATYGGPDTLARHAYDSFVSPPTGGTNLNSRLFSLSNDDRTVLWHAAWKQFEAHPIVGSGAGSFGRWWLAHRTVGYYFVQDTHNLYLQTLGELGLVGIVLLAVMLGVPLVAAVRARRHPLVAPALGGYVAYLVHAAVDWDWQMPAVTLLALFAGAAIVTAARRRDAEQRPLGTAGTDRARRRRRARRGGRVCGVDRKPRPLPRRRCGAARSGPNSCNPGGESAPVGPVVGAGAQGSRRRPAPTRPEAIRACRTARGGRQGPRGLGDLVRHRSRDRRLRAPGGACSGEGPEPLQPRDRRRHECCSRQGRLSPAVRVCPWSAVEGMNHKSDEETEDETVE